jgi:hypothetical protein
MPAATFQRSPTSPPERRVHSSGALESTAQDSQDSSLRPVLRAGTDEVPTVNSKPTPASEVTPGRPDASEVTYFGLYSSSAAPSATSTPAVEPLVPGETSHQLTRLPRDARVSWSSCVSSPRSAGISPRTDVRLCAHLRLHV